MDFITAVTAIAEFVANVGVPVACLGGAFWLLNKEREDHKSEVDALREATSGSNAKMIEAINNNTIVMQRIVDKLGV